ncbi:serine hydrolase domain-containing protein [Actinoplanes auranticolor]|uniref:Serine hydrolase n=1 Tax=Actinoplanes auranticolor TaxID=47988 RepID=A0A919SR49_9ACTN|nr:serine hydrolase domain-containing protein [Actinoplanes auranticolor]GIM76086.1 serine hydrolase [Actinoplanes auranticolor]
MPTSVSVRRMVAAVAVAAGLAAVAPAPAAQAGPRPDEVQRSIETLVGPGRYPGVLAAVRDRQGRAKHYTAGVGDLRSGAPVPVNGQVRIGSASKMFLAVVVLQLAGEGKLGLDESVETYLPGVVHGTGFEPDRITVRHLLQHTSGLPDYTEVMFTVVPGTELPDFFATRHRYHEPRALIDLALTAEPGPVGAGWAYSNTGYVLAGLIAQKVTGRPLAELITTRVIDRIGLRDTYVPGVGEQRVRGPHPLGYQRVPGGDLRDFTVMDPSWGWGAGQVVSTPGDLNTFLRALLDGKILGPAQLRQMRTVVDLGEGAGYGLGLMRAPLTCGGVAWGHGGDIPGYSTLDWATDDGRAVTLTVTAMTGSLRDSSVSGARGGIVDAALCAGR